MVKILFICHGNICRSPMAEFFMRDYVKKKNRAAAYEIASAATSSEEIGNLVHYGTRKELEKLGISTAGKRARKLTEADGKYYDFLIAMDRFNVRDTERIVGANYAHKIFRLLDVFGPHFLRFIDFLAVVALALLEVELDLVEALADRHFMML